MKLQLVCEEKEMINVVDVQSFIKACQEIGGHGDTLISWERDLLEGEDGKRDWVLFLTYKYVGI